VWDECGCFTRLGRDVAMNVLPEALVQDANGYADSNRKLAPLPR